jgi:glutathione S-transferase
MTIEPETVTTARSSRRTFGLAGAMTMMAALLPGSAARSAPSPMDAKDVDLTIYHIEGRRSGRIIWLCEELGLPYKLVFKPGDLMGSMALIREVNPLMTMAPTIKYKGQIFVESGGIIQMLVARHGKGRLAPAVESPDFPYYTQFLHFAEGTAMDRIAFTRMSAVVCNKSLEEMPKLPMVDPQKIMVFMNDHLSRHPYFGGQEFSGADIMMHMPAHGSFMMVGIQSNSFPHIADWRKRIRARPAFKRALDIALPGGNDGEWIPYGTPIPFVNPPAVFKPGDEKIYN